MLSDFVKIRQAIKLLLHVHIIITQTIYNINK